jgi:hypothetical protein
MLAVSTAPSDRTAVLIVRLWFEPDHAAGLRARITQTTASGDERAIAVVASADDICAVVKEWVERFLASNTG